MSVSSNWTSYAVCYINNVLMDAQNVSWGLEFNDTDIVTVTEGFAGRQKSARKLRVSIESAVPKDGNTVAELEKFSNSGEIVNLTLIVGDKSLSSKGFLESPKGSWSLDNPLGFTVEFVGEPSYLK